MSGIDIPGDTFDYIGRQVLWGLILCACLVVLIAAAAILSWVVKPPGQGRRLFSTLGTVAAVLLPTIYPLVPLLHGDSIDVVFLYFLLALVPLSGLALGLCLSLRVKNSIITSE